MVKLELHLLSDGYFTLDKNLLVYTKYQGQTYEAALKPLLVIAEGDRILIDTGVGELPEKHRRFHTIKREPGQALKAQLQKHNLKLEDIDMVINTHLHFDHCGNNASLPNAKFYMQEDELRYAYAPRQVSESRLHPRVFRRAHRIRASSRKASSNRRHNHHPNTWALHWASISHR